MSSEPAATAGSPAPAERGGIPPDRDPEMSGPAMVSLLGFFSSHPRHSVARVALWFSIAVLPLAVGALVIAWLIALSSDAAMGFVGNHGRAILLYGMAASGFAAGLGLTAGISARAARSRMLVADAGNPPLAFGIAILGLIALGSLPWLVPVAFDVNPRTRALLALLGVLPLLLVIAVVSLAPADDPHGRPVARRVKLWTLVFPVAVLVLLAMTRIGGIADAIARWSWLDALIRLFTRAAPSWAGEYVIEGDVGANFRGWLVTCIVTILLAPTLCIALMVVGMLRDAIVGDPAERIVRRRPSAESRASARGLIGEGRTRARNPSKAVGLALRASVPAEAADRADAAAPPAAADADAFSESAPAWIGELRSLIDPDGSCGDWSAERFSPGETSPPDAGKESFTEFFAGIAPSADQVAAFETVHRRYAESIAGGEDDAGAGASSADVLIEGPAGSGRTATVAAVAVHSVVVRGHAVLLIVPSAMKARSLIRRIRRSAEASGIGWYLNIGDLTEAGTDPWTRPGAEVADGAPRLASARAAEGARARSIDERNAEENSKRVSADLERSRVAPGSTPDILVGTLAQLEERFFSGASNHDRLRAVLCRIGMIVVEDLALMDVRHRVHLPAMLDKLRLLQGSEGLLPQTLVVTERLHDVSRSFVAERLLTGRQRISPSKLRPFRLPEEVGEPWQVTLRARQPGARGVSDLIERCAKACVGAGSDVVVFSPSMSASERNELAAAIDSSGPAEARVVADLDELDERECGDLGAVFHAATNGRGASLAIRARTGTGELVIFTVLPSGVPTLEEQPHAELPVLPDAASRALFATHFRSVSRFLRRLHPIHRDLWCRLGLPPTGDLSVVDGVDGSVPLASADDDRTVLLDPPDSVVVRAGRVGPWPWAALSAEGASGDGADRQPPAAPVEIAGMLDPSRAIEVAPGAARFRVVERRTAADGLEGTSERRIAEWVDPGGTSIASEDLAYSSRLLLDQGDRAFVALRATERDGKDRGKIRIDGQLWSERRSDAGQSSLLAVTVEDLGVPRLFVPSPSLQSALPRLVRIVDTELDARMLATERDACLREGRKPDPLDQRQFVTLRVDGLVSESGDFVREPFAIRYEVSSFFVLFGFSDSELSREGLRKDLFGEWTRPAALERRTLQPELGLAATFALRRIAPGLQRLAKVIGFSMVDAASGFRARYGLFVLEPASTRRSAYRLVDWVVRDPDLLRDFLGTTARALEEASGDAPGSAGRLFARGECAIGATTDGGSRLQIDRGRAAAIAAFLRAEVPQPPEG